MSYVIKVDRDQDFYVVWSDMVEAPLMWGNRLQTLDYLRGAALRPHGDPTNPEERVARADAHGSSALWPSPHAPIYGWDDSTLVYQQQGILRWCNLRELCDRYTPEDQNPDVSDLLEPFE